MAEVGRRQQKRQLTWTVFRFARHESGTTAVEFALISVPLFGLVFAIFQCTLAFYMQQGLRAAVDNAARSVLTGNAQNNAAISTWQNFRDQLVCLTPATTLLPNFVTCSNVLVDIRPASSFTALSAADVNASFVFSGGPQYSPGVPCQVMVVRAAYPVPSYLPLISWGANYSMVTNTAGLSTYNGQQVMMITAAAVFRNEPFVPTGGGTGVCPT